MIDYFVRRIFKGRYYKSRGWSSSEIGSIPLFSFFFFFFCDGTVARIAFSSSIERLLRVMYFFHVHVDAVSGTFKDSSLTSFEEHSNSMYVIRY